MRPYYLTAADEGRLTARGTSKKIGGRILYAVAEVTDGAGRLLAHGSAALMVMKGKRPDRGKPFPPKFIYD